METEQKKINEDFEKRLRILEAERIRTEEIVRQIKESVSDIKKIISTISTSINALSDQQTESYTKIKWLSAGLFAVLGAILGQVIPLFLNIH
jgi:septal ring factor EnvC (AmiA/AmiB activator)